MDAHNFAYERYRDPKICFIPTCSNSDKKNPGLRFFGVRKELKENWCQLVDRNCPKRQIYCCEDHLNLEEDLENYSKWIAGARSRLKLTATLKNFRGKPMEKNSNPTRESTSIVLADVQICRSASLEEDIENYRYWKLMNANAKLKPRLPASLLKRLPKIKTVKTEPSNETIQSAALCATVMYQEMQVKVSEQDAEPAPSDEAPLTPPWYPSSPGASDLSYLQDPLRKTTEQCRFCGEFSKECVPVSSHMPYVVGDKTTLSLNDMSVQLDFNNAILNTVCRDCDNKLTEFSAFVKLVKTSQDILANDVKTECESIADGDEADLSDIRPPEDNNISYRDIGDVKTEMPDEDIDIEEFDFSTFEEAVVVKRLSPKRKETKQKVKVAKKVKLDTVECDNEFIDIEGSRICDVREPDMVRAIVEPDSVNNTNSVARVFSKKKKSLDRTLVGSVILK